MARISRKSYDTSTRPEGGSNPGNSTGYISGLSILNDLGTSTPAATSWKSVAVLTGLKTAAQLPDGSIDAKQNVSASLFDGRDLALTATTITSVPSNLGWTTAGGKVDLTITSNGNYIIQLPSWIGANETFGTNGTKVISFYGSTNSALGSPVRNSTVEFIGSGNTSKLSVPAYQAGNPATFTISPTDTQYTTYVAGTTNYTVTLSNGASVTANLSNTTGFSIGTITAGTPGASTTNWTVPIVRTQNSGTSDKSTTISFNAQDGVGYVSSENRDFIQRANYSVSITTTPSTFPRAGGYQDISFTTVGAWTAAISGTDASSFTINNSSGNSGTNTIRVTATANSTFSTRSARLTISVAYSLGGGSVSSYKDLSQEAALATISLSKSGKTDFPYSGTTDSFTLDITPDSGNNGWTVSLDNQVGSSFQISTDNSTFTTGNLTGAGDTTIYVRALAHSSYTSQPRGVVTVTANYGGASATYTGYQLKKPNNIQLNGGNNLQLVDGALGTDVNVNLTMNSDALLNWTIVSNNNSGGANFLTITPNTGTYTGTARSINIKASSENPSSTQPRTATVSSTAEGFTSQIQVTQPAYQTVSVSPLEVNFISSDSTGNKTNVTIESNGGYKISKISGDIDKFTWYDTNGNQLSFTGTPPTYTNNSGGSTLVRISPSGTNTGTSDYLANYSINTLIGAGGSKNFVAKQQSPRTLTISPSTMTDFAASSPTEQLAMISSNTSWTAAISGTGFGISSTQTGTYGTTNITGTNGGSVWVKPTSDNSSSTARTGTLTLSGTGVTNVTRSLTQLGVYVGPTLYYAEVDIYSCFDCTATESGVIVASQTPLRRNTWYSDFGTPFKVLTVNLPEQPYSFEFQGPYTGYLDCASLCSGPSA